MKKVFIVHGFMGEPNGGWRPWLMGELAKQDIYACALPMPNPDDPTKKEWVKCIQGAICQENDDIYLVGHSLGSVAILHYLESLSNSFKISGALLVSCPYKILNPENPNSKLRKIDNFLDHNFDFNLIKNNAVKFTVIHGEKDDKVPINHAEFISQALDCNLIIIKDGDHLSGVPGWCENKYILEAVLEMLK